jgi:hypothetical protein
VHGHHIPPHPTTSHCMPPPRHRPNPHAALPAGFTASSQGRWSPISGILWGQHIPGHKQGSLDTPLIPRRLWRKYPFPPLRSNDQGPIVSLRPSPAPCHTPILRRMAKSVSVRHLGKVLRILACLADGVLLRSPNPTGIPSNASNCTTGIIGRCCHRLAPCTIRHRCPARIRRGSGGYPRQFSSDRP